MSGEFAGDPAQNSDLPDELIQARHEILDAGPVRALDPRLRRLGTLLLLAVLATAMAMRLHPHAGKLTTSLPVTPTVVAKPMPASDLAIAYTYDKPDPRGLQTLIAINFLNTSAHPMAIGGATLSEVGVPVAIEVLSGTAGNEALAEPIAHLESSFGQAKVVNQLTIRPGESFYVLIEVRPQCAHIGDIVPGPIRISYAFANSRAKTMTIPVGEVTGTISWLSNSVAQACGTASSVPIVTTTRILDGVTLTTSGPATIPESPFPIKVTAANFSTATFTGSIGILAQGELRAPAKDSGHLAGGLTLAGPATDAFTWYGTGYDEAGPGWYQTGILHSNSRMVPGGSLVWTFNVSFKRPPNAVGSLQGWLPVLLPVGPYEFPNTPDSANFPDLNVQAPQ